MADNNLRILYAEDEAITRMFVGKVLRTVADVTEAKDGQEALDLFHSDEFDLLVTDISMPRLTGDKLILEIKKTNEDFPCIVTTAYRSEYKHLEETADIIEKPVNLKKLLAIVSGYS